MAASASWFKNSTVIADFGRDQLFEKDGKRFGKFFLINDAVNLKNWKVSQDTINTRIASFRGKPYISEPGLAHFDTDKLPVNKILEKQENYRAGTIRDTVIGNDGTAYAIVEFEENALGIATWEDMQKGNAIYTSPAIAGYSQNINGVQLYTDWFGLHLARVATPAYGVFHATLKETCEGPEAECIRTLIASASAITAATAMDSPADSSEIMKQKTVYKMQSTSIADFDKMSDEDKKKAFSSMATAMEEKDKEIDEMKKTQTAMSPGMEGKKSDQITDAVPGKEKQSASAAEFEKLQKTVASYEAREKASLISALASMRVEAGLADDEDEEKKRLAQENASASIESLEKSVADFKPIAERMVDLASKAGIMPSEPGRIVSMPSSNPGVASASAGKKLPTNLKQLGGWA